MKTNITNQDSKNFINHVSEIINQPIPISHIVLEYYANEEEYIFSHYMSKNKQIEYIFSSNTTKDVLVIINNTKYKNGNIDLEFWKDGKILEIKHNINYCLTCAVDADTNTMYYNNANLKNPYIDSKSSYIIYYFHYYIFTRELNYYLDNKFFGCMNVLGARNIIYDEHKHQTLIGIYKNVFVFQTYNEMTAYVLNEDGSTNKTLYSIKFDNIDSHIHFNNDNIYFVQCANDVTNIFIHNVFSGEFKKKIILNLRCFISICVDDNYIYVYYLLEKELYGAVIAIKKQFVIKATTDEITV